MENVIPFLSFLGAVFGSVLFLGLTSRILLNPKTDVDPNKRISRKMLLGTLSILCACIIILALPVKDSTRDHILALVGILFSVVVALSSTTIVANSMGGVMLRATQPFKIGDFIHVGDYFGRVTERGLLDTEIQTETSDLVSLPNTYLISSPVTVVRSTGTIVTASLSLGYDVHHAKAQELLIEAARKAELEEPYAHVMELGNYAVTYRVFGFLKDVKSLITTRSRLRSEILDMLHENMIEIVSPTFTNQRRLAPEQTVIPSRYFNQSKEDAKEAEKIAFDKAEEAEKRAKLIDRVLKEMEGLESQIKEASDDQKQSLKAKLARKRAWLDKLSLSKEDSDNEPST